MYRRPPPKPAKPAEPAAPPLPTDRLLIKAAEDSPVRRLSIQEQLTGALPIDSEAERTAKAIEQARIDRETILELAAALELAAERCVRGEKRLGVPADRAKFFALVAAAVERATAYGYEPKREWIPKAPWIKTLV